MQEFPSLKSTPKSAKFYIESKFQLIQQVLLMEKHLQGVMRGTKFSILILEFRSSFTVFEFKYTNYIHNEAEKKFDELEYNYRKSFSDLRSLGEGIKESDHKTMVKNFLPPLPNSNFSF